MRITITRTTRPRPGSTLGFVPEKLFAHVELDPENLQLLFDLQPEQLAPMSLIEEEDRRWEIKDPLLFYTVVTCLGCRGRGRRENPQLLELVDLMKGHLTDAWELSWSTLEDLGVEIHKDREESQR